MNDWVTITRDKKGWAVALPGVSWVVAARDDEYI
jgi:hypothetical protein